MFTRIRYLCKHATWASTSSPVSCLQLLLTLKRPPNQNPFLHLRMLRTTPSIRKELKMMNLLALSLLLTSLFAAAVCSPSSSDNQENHKYEDVVVKEGHRFILVETYDEHGKHNTKISISPPQDPISTAEDGKFPSGFIENAKQKVKRAASSISSSAVSKSSGGDHLGELACEALGKCSHEIVTAIGKGKDKVSEKVH